MTPDVSFLEKAVTSRQIQGLNNADGLTAFFAYLGYNTESRITQTARNLGITAKSVAGQIKRIELIADQEGLLQVYLFELTSVTVAATQGIARVFRARAGNYLLVLTSDYERIDFVLLARVRPSGESGTIGQKQAGIRPRSLSVDRRNPERRHLRVLRRMTCTEGDPILQYQKLQAAYDVAYWSEEFFDNRQLFADYYLLKRLPEDDAWQEDPTLAYRKLRDLYPKARERWAGRPEAEVRKGLLLPILDILGFKAVQKKSSESDASEPDYHLCTPDGKTHVADCNVYTWERSLDGPDDRRDKETSEENPAAVAVSLLERGDANWAIVTNGKDWRLYSSRAHNKATNYYEVDLEEVLSREDPSESFRYFWLIFRREAYEPVEAEPREEGAPRKQCFLDRLFEGSRDYARELEVRLKTRVFDHIFPQFAEGFIEHIGQTRGVTRSDVPQEELDAIYQGTLTFLYRLLFLLYAESRDLLPIKEYHGYFQKSLTKLKREVEDTLGTERHAILGILKNRYGTKGYELYDRLSELFRIIDKGAADVNVPVYNGGLFLTEVADDDRTPEAANARFLLQHKLPDRYLALGLDLLARDEDQKTFDLVPIDYKSLGVRQLGSIYEGLLEFKVRIADQRLAVIKEKGREVYKPTRHLTEAERKRWERAMARQEKQRDLFGPVAARAVVKKNEVYLENDKRERKATGSYYTPDHIVEYIVEHTVGPVFQEKLEALRPKLRQAQKDRDAFFKRQKGFEKEGLKPEPDAKADLAGHELVEPFFNIKVLDPAMGSGHFLVEAVDLITNRMLDFLNAFPWNPIRVHLDNMRRTILSGMEDQGITIDEKRLTDVNLLKRHVLKRCIYGVDLNPMAVELAKVSLWLDCFTLGAPLSFLDHHLRCGNSLIGVDVATARKSLEPQEVKGGKKRVAREGKWHKKRYETEPQLTLFASRFAGLLLATDLMRHVGSLSDITDAQVHQSRLEYRKASDALVPFKRILDVYTSQWFADLSGKKRRRRNAGGRELPVVSFLKSREAEVFLNAKNADELARAIATLSENDRQVVEEALRVASNHRFFHWELEFPEVFYGPAEGTRQKIVRLRDGGFDAVVANPPYVNAIELNRILSPFEKPFWRLVFETAAGAYDLYVLFLEKCFHLLASQGRAGLITPNKYLSAPYAERLRTFIHDNAVIARLLDVSRQDVFGDPSVYPIVTVYHRKCGDPPAVVYVDRPLDREGNNATVEQNYCDLSMLPGYVWGFLLSSGVSLLAKVVKDSEKFEDICDIAASSTVAEADKLYLHLTESKDPDKEGWPVVNTGTIVPYGLMWGNMPMTNKGRRYAHPWLPGNSPVSENRRTRYSAPKLIFAKVAKRIRAAFDEEGRFASLNTNFAFAEGEDGYYYLGLVNSRLLTWIYEQYFGALRMGGGYLQFQAPQLRLLPLKRYDPENSLAGEIARLSKRISSDLQKEAHGESEIDALVYRLYGLTEDEIAIVEAH